MRTEQDAGDLTGPIARATPQAALDRHRWFAPALLVVVGLGLYLPTLSAPFVFDDTAALLNNPSIRRLWPLSQPMTAPRDSPYAGRPLANLLAALTYAVAGLDARAHRAVNLAAHLLAALLLYHLLLRLLRLARWGLTATSARGLALASALIWSVHPLTSEPVMITAYRTESLMAACVLGTWLCALRGLGPPRDRRWDAAAVATCALGMACKETMVVAPVVVIGFEAAALFPSLSQAFRQRHGFYAALASTWLILAWLIAPGPRSGSTGSAVGSSAWRYALTQTGVILHYLRLGLWPHPLSLDYQDWPLASSLAATWPSVLVVGALAAATLIGLRRRHWLGLVGAWAFLLLAPTSSLVPLLQPCAERRTYLPLAGLILAVVVGAWRLLRGRLSSPSARGVVGAVLTGTIGAGFLIASICRAADYRSELAIAWQTATARPANSGAQNDLGHALASLGRLDEAIQRYRTAIALRPEHPMAYNNLALALRAQGRREEALSQLLRALELDPRLAPALLNLGKWQADEGRLDEAIATYERALASEPSFMQAHNNLANALARQGRFEEASRHLAQAIRLAPENATLYYNLGNLQMQQGRSQEAAASYRRALRLAPKLESARRNLAVALAKAGALPGQAGGSD